MSRLIESICIFNGEIRNLPEHQIRMNRARKELFGLEDECSLQPIIQSELAKRNYGKGKFKCRILYQQEIEFMEILPYQIQPLHSFRLVEASEIDYSYKWENRTSLIQLKNSVLEDEIILVKNGRITDTSYSNLVFFDGENWITPAYPLLNGTMRQALLKQKKIAEEEINPKDLNRFFSFKLINAMMNLDESPQLPVSIIV